MQTGNTTLSSNEGRSSDLRWCHPLADFLGGTGLWISHVAVAIGVIGMVLLTWFDVQTDGVWGIVAAPATMVFGVAVLFAFAGWIARSSRYSSKKDGQ